MICSVALNENYLEKIAQIVYEYCDVHALKVILPTVSSCLKLQRILISNAPNNTCLLPQIIPIMNIVTNSEGIYNVPKEYLEPVSFLEQKILIATIILKSTRDRGRLIATSEIGINHALRLANDIIRLFDELKLYNVDIENLKNIQIYNDAEHWQYMFEFLLSIYEKWVDIQLQQKKIDTATYKRNMLQMEIADIRRGNDNIIMAGVMLNGQLVRELADVIACSANGRLILPQMDGSVVDLNTPVTHKKYIKHIFASYSNLSTQTQNASEKMGNVQTFVAPNILLEADGVVCKALEWLKGNVIDIAIVSENVNLVQMITDKLYALNVETINLNGYLLNKTKVYEFFMLLIKVFDSKYGVNLENLLILIKSPFLFSEEIVLFECKIRGQQITSDEALQKFCNEHELQFALYNILLKWNKRLAGIYNGDVCCFSRILSCHIELAEQLVPFLWSSDEGKCLSDLLYDIRSVNELPVGELKDYIDFLYNIMSGARYFKKFVGQKILFMSLEDASIGGYRNIICVDMNEGSLPKSLIQDPWMNTSIRTEIGLPDNAQNIGIAWYYFNNLLYRDNIYLTRSSKHNGVDTIVSRFWRQYMSDNLLDDPIQNTQSIASRANDGVLCCTHPLPFASLPSKISATNLELLIRNPYAFYGKNILQLRKLNNVFEHNNLARFGNFLHKIFQEYTNKYDAKIDDKFQFISEISNALYQKLSFPMASLWKPKIQAVLREFIEFDTDRRSMGVKVFSEIYGEMEFVINNRTIKITAIADRVEQDSCGNIYILDYKTGTLPSKQDVLRGISVQMLVEAMIANSGGFYDIKHGKVSSISYIKIASRAPYIETVNYDMEEINLVEHRHGLEKILKYYDNSQEFLVNENVDFSPKYDDYRHLSRTY